MRWTKTAAGAGALAAACALVVAAGVTAGPAGTPDLSGVVGKVSLVPNDCPAVDCEGRPIRARVAAFKRHRLIAASLTGRKGHYALTLRPGDYTIRARPVARHVRCRRVRPHVIVCKRGHYRRHIRCVPVEVTVPEGEYVRAPITCHRIARKPEPASEVG
jgi:hypothetical protein